MAVNTAFVKSPVGLTLILATVFALVSFAVFESPPGVASTPKANKMAFYEFATAASWVISLVLLVTVVLEVWESCSAGIRTKQGIFLVVNGLIWGLLLVIAAALLLDDLVPLLSGLQQSGLRLTVPFLDAWVASAAIALLAALMFFIHAFLAFRTDQKPVSDPAHASPITTAHFTGR